ncbi:hypothetical protein BGZ76_003593, partial [Entomortierella beljakovae]
HEQNPPNYKTFTSNPSFSIGKAVPTFLQPNTTLSSRDAIFNDGYNLKKRKSQRPGKGGSDSDSDGDDGDDDEEARKLILEKLYGQMSGSIQIEDQSSSSTSAGSGSSNEISSTVDMEGIAGEEDDDEDNAMEFRLFSAQDTPTKITITAREPEIMHIHRERAELDESPRSIRMQQIKEAAIDAALVLSQSKVPWERTFFSHKVKLITLKEQQGTGDSKKVKKSKRKREWEKKLKAGLIDQSSIVATARKIKVSESWGQEPYLVPKGLGKNTIDVGTGTGIRDSRRGRGGKFMRGSSRGAMRGSMRGGQGNYSGDRGSRPSPMDKKNSGGDAPPKKNDPQAPTASLNSVPKSTPVSSKKSESTPTSNSSSKPTLAPTPNEPKSVLPSKKPKNKQDRKKIREVNTALRDTTTESELTEYEALEAKGKLDKEGVKKLAELREKLNKINDIKKAHGIKLKPKKAEQENPISVAEPARDPTRSIYYDPVLNPYGAPPPGQPYLEYPPLPQDVPAGMEGAPGSQPPIDEESEDSDDSDSDSDSDSSSSGSDSDDPDDEKFMPSLPEGPPPPKADQARFIELTKPKFIPPPIQQHTTHQWPPMQGGPGNYGPGMPHPGMPHPGMQGPPGNPYGHPMGPPFGNIYPGPGLGPPPPMGFIPPPIQAGPGFGPPPHGYRPPGYGPPGHFIDQNGPPGYGPPGFQGLPHHPRPMRPPQQRPPPRYVRPPRTSDPQSDPMTGHLPPDEKEVRRAAELKEKSGAGAQEAEDTQGTPASHPLPPRPATAQTPAKPTQAAGSASISAEPQLRNLQKELVHLVPSTIMRKRVTQKGKIGKPVNAAPGVDEDGEESSTTSFGKLGSTRSTISSSTTQSDTSISSSPVKGDGESEPEYRETGLGLRLPRINLAPSVPSILGPRKIVVNSAPEVPVTIDREAKKKAEYDEFLQGLEGDGLL